MPAVWASASDTASIVTGTVAPTAMPSPKSEKALRRVIAAVAVLMLCSMIQPVRSIIMSDWRMDNIDPGQGKSRTPLFSACRYRDDQFWHVASEHRGAEHVRSAGYIKVNLLHYRARIDQTVVAVSFAMDLVIL